MFPGFDDFTRFFTDAADAVDVIAAAVDRIVIRVALLACIVYGAYRLVLGHRERGGK